MHLATKVVRRWCGGAEVRDAVTKRRQPCSQLLVLGGMDASDVEHGKPSSVTHDKHQLLDTTGLGRSWGKRLWGAAARSWAGVMGENGHCLVGWAGEGRPPSAAVRGSGAGDGGARCIPPPSCPRPPWIHESLLHICFEHLWLFRPAWSCRVAPMQRTGSCRRLVAPPPRATNSAHHPRKLRLPVTLRHARNPASSATLHLRLACRARRTRPRPRPRAR